MVQKITHLSQAQNMPRPGREPQRSGTPALITGETGDCCEDDYPHRSIVFDEDNQVFRDMYRQLLEGPMHPDTSTQYYGVVVQARETSSGALGGAAASGSGCYLLKVRSATRSCPHDQDQP